MKKNAFLFALLLFAGILRAQYDKLNIELIGHWYNPMQVPEPTYGIKYNGCWAWVDTADGMHEYAIIGSGSGTHIIDLANPFLPEEVDFVPGRRANCIWREYKTYGNYLYAISDDASPNSFQIMDLSYLPDSVHVIHDATTIFERAHTLFIDGDKLYCGSVTRSTGAYYSMAIYSLANPVAPALLHQLNQDYSVPTTVHDMLVRNDTVYASGGNDGLFIYKYNETGNVFSLINSLTSYPEQGYNHSSAITTHGKTLVFCDEVPRDRAVKVLDISDLSNISVASTFRSGVGPTPHNPYMSDNKNLFIAYYQDGLQLFDLSNPASPVRTGYFDTDTLDGPDNNYNLSGPAYHGNWGAYIDLPSGYIIASDMQNGLYVLDASAALGISEAKKDDLQVSVYPNPSSGNVTLLFNSPEGTTAHISLFDVSGRVVMNATEKVNSGTASATFDISALSPGMYVVSLRIGDTVQYSRLIRK